MISNLSNLTLLLNGEEAEIYKAIVDARSIQEFLWREESWSNKPFEPEAWARILNKRVEKILDLRTEDEGWKVEARKRLLQLASLSIKGLQALQT